MDTSLALEATRCLSCGAAEHHPVATCPVQMTEAQGDTPELYHFVRCDRCGLVYLNPRVPPAALGRFYDETYLPHRGASAWGRYAPLVEGAERGTDRARVGRARAAFPLGPGHRALDVGCGRPTYLEALHQATGAACVGIDFSPDAWRGEAERFAALDLRAGDLGALDLKPPFHVISLWHALEHAYDPLDTLRQLRALAAPGAGIVIEVPDFDAVTRRLHGPRWAGYHTPRHTAVFTAATLTALMERAGWTVEGVDRWGTLDPYVLWWLGHEEAAGRSLRGDLSGRFVPFVIGKVLSLPVAALQRWVPLGLMVAVGRA